MSDQIGDISPGRRPQLVGLLLVLAAAMLWSLNGALIKLVNEDGRGPHGVTIAFYRSLIAGLFLLPFGWRGFRTLRSSKRPASRLPIRPTAIWCVIFFSLMTVSFVVANTMTHAANAILLQYTSTFWIFGLSPWLLGEKPNRSDLWILGLAMIGIGVIFAGPWIAERMGIDIGLGSDVNASVSIAGLFIALSAGLFYGLLTLMIRRMRDCDSASVTVLNNLGAAVLLVVPAILVGQLMLTPRAWLFVTFMGIVQFGLPYYFYTLGLARIPAHQAALITMAEPVLVPIWTYLAIGEVPVVTTLIGGGVILMALLLFAASAHRRA